MARDVRFKPKFKFHTNKSNDKKSNLIGFNVQTLGSDTAHKTTLSKLFSGLKKSKFTYSSLT